MSDIEWALEITTRVSATLYGQHALTGDEQTAENLQTLHRMAVVRCRQERGYALAWAICGIAPSCCIRPRRSTLLQYSTALLPAKRQIAIPVYVTALPLG